MRERTGRWTAWTPGTWSRALLLAALAAWLLFASVRDFPNQLGMDLYHPWGIERVRDAEPGVPNPYVDAGHYGRVLFDEASAVRVSSPKFWVTALMWQSRSDAMFEPTGTPLFYALLSRLPHSYERTHLAWALAQHAAFLAAMMMLARMAGFGVLGAACIAVGVAASYSGFVQDVKYGNVNSLQLLFLVAMIRASARALYRTSRAFDLLYLPALALFLTIKPNMALPALALAAHYLHARGARRFAVGAAGAIAVACAGVALGAWHFGEWAVWRDWFEYTRGGHGGTVFYSVDNGNQSLAMLLAEKSSAYGPVGNSIMLMAVLATAGLVAASAQGRRGDLVLPTVSRVLGDPWLATALAVVAMCATSPLFWHHYYVAMLIPLAYLVRRDSTALQRGCAVASFVVLTVPWLQMLSDAKLFGVAYTLLFFAWAPLVPAMLADLARVRREIDPRAQAA